MKKFFYMAQGGRLNEMECTTAEMVYRAICCFYMPSTPIIIVDQETNESFIFTRKIDKNGNLISIKEILRNKEIY